MTLTLPSTDHRATKRIPRWRVTFGALALVMTVLTAACGSNDQFASIEESTEADASFAPGDSAGSADGSFMDADEAASSDESGGFDLATEESLAEAEAPAASTTGSTGGQPTAQLPDLGRDIIFTATLELATTDISAATRDAITAIEGRGGFLFSQQTQGGPGGSSVLTFKVLPDQFQSALNDLGSIGTVRSQSISAEDVSAIVVDLESRITTAEASVTRLRKLLDEASALETIATLENQLLERETVLEQLRGQLRSVRSQVDLATITVVVSELLNRPGLAIEVMSFAGHDAGFSCFDTTASRGGEVGDPFTLCYRLFNSGDAALVDLALEDVALGATIQDLVVVDGDVTQLDPGEAVLLAYEFELNEPVRVRPIVTATALNDAGEPIEEQVKATGGTIRFEVTNFEDDLPGFGETLRKSWNALAKTAQVIALIAVAIAPFVVVAALLALAAAPLLRRWKAARARRVVRSAPPVDMAPQPSAPPPPPPAAASPTAAPQPAPPQPSAPQPASTSQP